MSFRQWQKITKQFINLGKDEAFLGLLEQVERFVSKVLSAALVIVILVATVDLGIFLFKEVFTPPLGSFSTTLIELFGLFLDILIALELLENITAYLRKQVVQVQLVITTALIAVARKLVVFDFSKASSSELIGLGIAIFALAVSYWIVSRARISN